MLKKLNKAIETEIEEEYQMHCKEHRETSDRNQFYEEFLRKLIEVVMEATVWLDL